MRKVPVGKGVFEQDQQGHAHDAVKRAGMEV